MLIGALSKRSGVSRDTIRYYEKLSLLVAKDRHAGNRYKRYGREALDRLHHIKQLKDVGFTLREIHGLLSSEENLHPCDGLPRKIGKKIERIDAQIALLVGFKASLVEMRAACRGNCDSPGGIPTCVPSASSPQSSKCC